MRDCCTAGGIVSSAVLREAGRRAHPPAHDIVRRHGLAAPRRILPAGFRPHRRARAGCQPVRRVLKRRTLLLGQRSALRCRVEHDARPRKEVWRISPCEPYSVVPYEELECVLCQRVSSSNTSSPKTTGCDRNRLEARRRAAVGRTPTHANPGREAAADTRRSLLRGSA